MFEPQDHPNDFQYPGGPPVRPYDAAGWTPAYTMGIQFDRILEDVNGPFETLPYGEIQKAKPVFATGAYYSFATSDNASFTLLNDLLNDSSFKILVISESLTSLVCLISK